VTLEPVNVGNTFILLALVLTAATDTTQFTDYMLVSDNIMTHKENIKLAVSRLTN